MAFFHEIMMKSPTFEFEIPASTQKLDLDRIWICQFNYYKYLQSTQYRISPNIE